MAMKQCKECGADVSSSAKVCPQCGKKLKHTGLRVFLGLIVVLFALGALASMGGNTTQTSSQTKPQENFTLVSDKRVTDSIGTTYIEGEIKNNTNKSYTYVQVTFNLYDADGNQLGTAVANINNLEPNGTWKYKAIGLTSQAVSSYKFVEITGW